MNTRNMFLSLTLILSVAAPAWCETSENEELKSRIAALEARILALEKSLAPLIAQAKTEQLRIAQQTKARSRMRKDAANYKREELQEIEKLYQVANKNWQTPEARNSLQKLVEKYDKANRTGCAILYLGQMSKGEEQVEYLKQAIEQFSDCYYGDGVQVGAFARLLLAQVYLNDNKPDEAEKLFDQLRQQYPDAIDHRGNAILSQLPKSQP